MAAKSSLLNMALCLSAVCLVCSSILAAVYAMTCDPIKAADAAKTRASIAQVLPAGNGEAELCKTTVEGTEYSYYKVEGSGYAIIVRTAGFGGPLTVMVGIDNAGIITNSKVLSHSETPGLGAKCSSEDFTNQFKSWDPATKKLSVKKDGGDVDAITASTITSRAYSLALATACKVYKSINITAEGGQDNE